MYYVADFLIAKELEGLNQSTIDLYERFLRYSSDGMPGDWTRITTPDIRRYLASLTCSETTRAIYIRILRTLFRWMVKEGYRDDDPMARIPNPRLPQVYPKVIGDADIRKMIQEVKNSPRDLSIILMLLDTGLRASELCSLQLADADDDRVVVTNGKGRKARVIFLSPLTVRALKRYLCTRTDSDACLFRSQRGGSLDKNSLRLMLNRVAKRAGVESSHNPHAWRHTMATAYVRAGGDSHSLQRVMGHSTTAMAEAYVHLSGRDVQEAHQRYSPVVRLRLV